MWNERARLVSIRNLSERYGARGYKVYSGIPLVREVYRVFKPERVAIAFSGGADSLATVLMVLEGLPDSVEKHVIFNNTTNEFPENIRYVREMFDFFEENFENVKCVEVKPRKHFADYVRRVYYVSAKMKINGGWKKQKLRCCFNLKEKPSEEYYKENNIKIVFTGLRAGESIFRYRFTVFALTRGFAGVYIGKNKINAMPVWNWSREQVHKYLEKHPLKPKVNPLYEKGFRQIGCMLCPVKFFFDKELPPLREHYPHVYKVGLRLKREAIGKIFLEESVKL